METFCSEPCCVALLAVLASSVGGCEPATCFTVEECCSNSVKCMAYCVSCVESVPLAFRTKSAITQT